MSEWCPGCEGGVPPPGSNAVIVRCKTHDLNFHGVDDDRVAVVATVNHEAGGDSNRAFCDFLVRKTLRPELEEEETTSVPTDFSDVV